MEFYTIDGLERLAEIVRTARGKEEQRPFARRLGVSHRTIDRLEKAEYSTEPTMQILSKIAPATGYKVEELVAIARGSKFDDVRKYLTAEDVFPAIDQLPPAEVAKIAHYAIDKLK